MNQTATQPTNDRAARTLLAALVCAFAAYVALVLAMPASLPYRGVVADVGYLAFPTLAALLWRQAARTAADATQRRGLHLLFAAQLFGIANQFVWILDSAGWLDTNSPAFEIAGLAMTISTAAGLLYLVPGRSVAGSLTVVPRIDASLVALACLSVGWHFVGAPVLRSGRETGGEFLWLATVAGGDLFTAVIALSAWAFAGQRLRPTSAAALAAGLGLTALMDVLLEAQSLSGTYRSGGVVDVAFASSIVLVGYAAYLETLPSHEPLARRVRRAVVLRLLLPVVAAAAVLLPVIAQAWHPVAGRERFVPAGLLVLFIVLMQVRFMALERGAEQSFTTRLALERDLRLSQQFESLGRYAASVAHDMGNLLAALLAQVHVLKLTTGANGGGNGIGTRLAEMERTLGAGTTLTHRLMQMSRGGEAEREPVDLARSARNMALTMGGLLPTNVSLGLECPSTPVVVSLRPGDADQVLLNLLVNARDALPRGGHIKLRVLCENGHAVLDVADDGAGIPPQLLGRIFDPFFTTRGDKGGTGLGLSTVKSIVTQSGGTIDVSSEPERGARFSVRWPLSAS